jgi:hypothetical protein
VTHAAAAAAAAALSLGASACGGGDPQERARGHFEDYRAAEQQRSEAEAGLRKAFGEVARGAADRDRLGVSAAAERGLRSASQIRELLDAEIEAAAAIAAYEPAAKDARALEAALRRSGVGLEALAKQLTIALRDPFLDEPANERQVSRLSARSLDHSVPAAFARRHAARALALVLDVEPPFDVIFDFPAED